MLHLLSALALAQDSSPPAPQDGSTWSGNAVPAPTEPVPAPATTAPASLQDAASVLDPDASAEERAAAAARLGLSAEGAVIIEAAVASRDAEVQTQALAALAGLPGAEPAALAAAAARDLRYAPEVRTAALDALVAMKRPEAGDALWELAEDEGVDREVREQARRLLEEHYPEVVQARGAPSAASSLFGVGVGSVGNGVVGATMLSAVGVWGANKVAVGIGGVGGAVIGLGTGVLYGAGMGATNGQGLAYASAAGWGLAGSLMATEAIFGDREMLYGYDQRDAWERYGDRAAAVRVLGMGTAAVVGMKAVKADPEPGDVLEADLAGYLLAQTGVAVMDLANPVGYCYPDPYTNPPADCGPNSKRHQARYGVGLAGAALGVGGAMLAQPGWEMDPADFMLATAIAGESGWVAGWTPTMLDAAEPQGNIRLGLHGGMLAGLGVAHFVQPSAKMGPMTAWGAMLGNGMGAGAAMLARESDSVSVTRVMVPVGVVGTAAGALLADVAAPQGGDVAMLGVGVPIAFAEGAALGTYLDFRGITENNQAVGSFLLVSSLGSAGVSALSPFVDPKAKNMFFVGSAAAWGTWLGVLTPLALDAQIQDDTRVLVAMGTGNAVMLAGGVSVLQGLDPRRTVIPQLAGVTGSTLGALGAAMASSEGQAVAAGALIGGVVGLGAGTAVEVVHGPSDLALDLPRPRVDLPGQWAFAAAPTRMEDGSNGVAVSVVARED